MFERTSILGGVRLVCPYHVEKKQESKSSWNRILTSVGVLFALGSAGYLIYRNKDKFQFGPFKNTGPDNHNDGDGGYVVEFETGLTKLKQNRTSLEIDRGLQASERGGYETVQSWVDAASAPALGIPLESRVFTSSVYTTLGTSATAPVPSDVESSHDGGSVVSVERDPDSREEVGGSYVAVSRRRGQVFIR